LSSWSNGIETETKCQQLQRIKIIKVGMIKISIFCSIFDLELKVVLWMLTSYYSIKLSFCFHTNIIDICIHWHSILTSAPWTETWLLELVFAHTRGLLTAISRKTRQIQFLHHLMSFRVKCICRLLLLLIGNQGKQMLPLKG
jgi:hypothetical protein